MTHLLVVHHFMYRLEAMKRNLSNLESEARIASGGFLTAKISS